MNPGAFVAVFLLYLVGWGYTVGYLIERQKWAQNSAIFASLFWPIVAPWLFFFYFKSTLLPWCIRAPLRFKLFLNTTLKEDITRTHRKRGEK